MDRSKIEEIFKRHIIDSNDEPWDANHLDKQLSDNDAIIHWVSRYGTAEDLKTLIDAGASINIQGDIGRTPLLESVAFNKENNAKVLLAAGADISAKDDYGDSVLDLVPDNNLSLKEVLQKNV